MIAVSCSLQIILHYMPIYPIHKRLNGICGWHSHCSEEGLMKCYFILDVIADEGWTTLASTLKASVQVKINRFETQQLYFTAIHF